MFADQDKIYFQHARAIRTKGERLEKIVYKKRDLDLLVFAFASDVMRLKSSLTDTNK